ncbi:sensor histidine kinase [Atopobacter phocae]|uniref:sensor histidine kinase n=1 Tax=Atopobacter phocae TaxID=136492 RepID=UPI00046F873B|nr:ATP-binding protein [Atopobacter phocae]
MTKRIFRAIVMIAMGVFLASLILISGFLYRYFSAVQMEQLRTQTELVAQGISTGGKAYAEALKVGNLRVTWIDAEGVVMYDSRTAPEMMENHYERTEVIQARAQGYGESVRYSSTLTQNYLYSAQRLEDGTIVRLAVTQTSVLQLLVGLLHPMAIVLLIAIILAFISAKYTSKKLVEPLNDLDLDQPLSNVVYDELSPLLRRIDQHQKKSEEQVMLLNRQKKEFDTTISKIKEGIILLNEKGQIVSMNTAARQLFQIKELNSDDYLLHHTRQVELIQAINQGLTGAKQERMVDINGMYYRTLVRPVLSEQQLTGVVVLMFDVTDEVQNERMRREFTANVSHELKTPLQTISGYSEILKNNLVSEEYIQSFSGKIFSESQRLIQLVEDIIHLSQLDEMTELAMQPVDLYQVVHHVKESLAVVADEKAIQMNVIGQSTLLFAHPSLIHSIVYNLCDNAIKYNRQKGQVTVTLSKTDEHVLLEVKDSGVGIPTDDLDRIFERFYRVDKSRSKGAGGTGLGLSIVKHAALLHQAEINVWSEVGLGTTVRVQFKRAKEQDLLQIEGSVGNLVQK